LEQEIKEAKRLVMEDVNLMNSPISYLEVRYDYLYFNKLPALEYDFHIGLLTEQQFEVEQELIATEMNLIRDIMTERSFDNNENITNFPSINTVFEGEVDNSISFLDQVENFKILFDFFCKRQNQINAFNFYYNLINNMKTKPNGELN
jgi:hypothetical protein